MLGWPKASRQRAQAHAPSGLNLTCGALRLVAVDSAGEDAGPPTGGAHLSGSSPTSGREDEEHVGEAADALRPQEGLEWVRHDVAYLLVVGTTSERQGFTGNEEAVKEEFREVVEEVSRNTEMVGRVGGKLPGVEGISLVGRGAQESSCSWRSIGAPRRRGFGRSRAPGLYSLLGCLRRCYWSW